MKTIGDDGSCSGMYYNGGHVLDIGGPETCTLSADAHDGYYDLVVKQSMNQETLQVKLDGSTMTILSGGQPVVTLTKH